MRRLALIALALISVAFITQAEAPAFAPVQKKQEPLKLEEENGKKVLKLAGTRDISTEQLVDWFVETSGHQFINSARGTNLGSIRVVSPAEGKTYDTLGIEKLLYDALWQSKLVLVEVSSGRYSVSPAAEVAAYTPVITLDELAGLPAHRWATLKLDTHFADRVEFRSAFTSRLIEGLTYASAGRSIWLTGRADALLQGAELVKTVNDAAALRQTRVYTLPADIQPQAVTDLLNAHVRREQYLPKAFAVLMPGTRVVVICAMAEQHEQVTAAIEKLEEIKERPNVATEVTLLRYEVPERVSVDDCQDALTKLFKSSPDGRPVMVAVPGAHALVVRATPRVHDEVKKFMELIR